MKFACSNKLEHFPKRLFYQNEVKCNIERTMVLKVKKTAVLVLMPGLVDRSWSRTVPSLVRIPDFTRRPEGETDQTSSILLRGLHGDRLQGVRHRELAVLHAVQVAAPRRQVEVVRHLEASKTAFQTIIDTFPLLNHSQILLHLSLLDVRRPRQ